MKTKTLYLIRHGKAEDHSFLKRDYERNLVQKGQDRAAFVAKKLSQQLLDNYTLVISSSANRALQTAEIFCAHIDYPIKSIQQEKEIYEAYYRDILQVINQVDDNIETVLVFGHNPGLSDLTNYLCDSYIDLNTSHVSKICLPEGFNFSEVSGGTCHLETVITE
jgi:phosphohistidine phosphatase